MLYTDFLETRTRVIYTYIYIYICYVNNGHDHTALSYHQLFHPIEHFPTIFQNRFRSTVVVRLDSHIFKRRFFTISTSALVPLESECQRFALRFTANGEIRNVGHDSLHFFFSFLPPSASSPSPFKFSIPFFLSKKIIV